MKVTKHGKKYDDGTPFAGTCWQCGCEVEATRGEIKSRDSQREVGTSYDSVYVYETEHYVTCPECKHDSVIINDKRLGK